MTRATSGRGRVPPGARGLEYDGGSCRRGRCFPGVRVLRFVSLLLVALGTCAPLAHAQPDIDLSHWRFYSSVDGLRESWVEDITAGQQGRFWITHGTVDAMTLFDGYTFKRLPTPGVNLTVRESADGQVWALHRGTSSAIDGVQIFENQQWTAFPVPGLAPIRTDAFVSWRRDRVLVASGDSVVEFSRSAKAAQVLRQAAETPLRAFFAFEPRRAGGAWIGGRGAIAAIEPAETAGTLGAWREHALPPEFRQDDVIQIHDVASHGLFVTARAQDGYTALLVFRDGAWRLLTRSSTSDMVVEGWAADTETWLVMRSNRTFVVDLTDVTGSRRLPVRRSSSLAGQFHRALVDSTGAFWIATSLGLARHAPVVWRTPTELVGRERHVGALFECRNGDLVANSEGALLWRPKNQAWRVMPTPGGISAMDMTDGVGELPDGRLVLNAQRFDPFALLTFDPATGTFGWFTHPEGRVMDLLARSPGLMWFHTRADGQSRLETFDGQSFTTRYEAGTRWHVVPPRGLLVTTGGDVFVLQEGTGVGRLQRDGTYQTIGSAEGYPGAGPFCGIEIAPGRYWFGDRDGIIELTGATWRVLRSGMQTVRAFSRGREGTIWATSGTGLHAYRNGSWLTVTAVEGLPEGGVYDVLEDRDGVMWASTTLGLSRNYPETDTDTPDTTLDPSLNPREVPPSGDARLVFSGVDRWQQSPVRRLLYSWRVDGGPWSPFTPDAGASLHELTAGAHQVDVRAMDRNWNIDPTPATLQFRVLLSWYRETGFLLVGLAGAVALGAVVGLVASRHRRLGRLVSERTAELNESNRQIRRELEDRQRVEEERARLEAQLHQAQKLEAIGRLAGGISHDFNNLLTVIISYGELLAEDLPPNHPLHTPAVEVVGAAQRAAALTRQLLAFGRHQVIRPQPLDLNAVVGDIERMLRRLIGEDIDLECRPGAALRHVLADRGQIEQVIVNLAVNARDAMPDGGKLTIETANIEIDDTFLRTHVGPAAGQYVLLAVSDNGVGMDEETQARIFEPFFTTKARDKGSGLGLATVYGIVKQAGGYVWVYSEPRHGATFKIYLPCTAAPPASATQPRAGNRQRGTETVLLVEDDDAVRSLASVVLRQHGYKVMEAASAEAAERILHSDHESIDLVLSDIVLSGMSGPQLSEKLRKTRPDIQMRFMFMSGYADDAVIRHGILETEVAFIQKPFTPDGLARKVRETLDSSLRPS